MSRHEKEGKQEDTYTKTESQFHPYFVSFNIECILSNAQ